MGYLSNIKFKNFRNFNESFFSFDKGCNIITGKNGTGKTNLLEGISLIEKGRGFRKEKIYNLINFNNKDQFFNIDSNYFHKELDYKILDQFAFHTKYGVWPKQEVTTPQVIVAPTHESHATSSMMRYTGQ